MRQTVIRSNAFLLEKSRLIFGDIVQDAYVSTYAYPSCLESEIADRLNGATQLIEGKSDSRHITYDAEDIMLVFTNGHKVWFGNSEWATIRCNHHGDGMALTENEWRWVR